MKGAKIRWAMLLVTTGIVTVLALATPVQAQTTGLVVEIPFEFHVGQQLLPSGTYTVWLRGGSVISVSDGNGRTALSQTNAMDRPHARNAANSILVFTNYNNRHFLSEVRWAGYQNGRALMKSKTELDYAKAIQVPTAATIAAR